MFKTQSQAPMTID